jgi:UDP-glucose 4-epimerase
MRIVVTGATGNVGSALLRRWQGSEHDVVGVARRQPEPGSPLAADGRMTWVRLDLADPDQALSLRDVFDGADAVVHLAWALQPMHDRGYQRRVNLGGSALCLAEAVTVGVPHVVVASSIGAYSPRRHDGFVDETYPTGGIPSCGYSQDKRVLEGLIRDLVGEGVGGGSDKPRTRIATIRPALVGQRQAGSQMVRMGLPLLTPAATLTHFPYFLLDRHLGLQAVHADDVAQAVDRILTLRADGPFNLVGDGVLGPEQVAAAFGARFLPLPWQATRAAARIPWSLRLGPLDPSWITMAHTVPRVSARRAREELGWAPRHTAIQVLTELAEGMAHGGSDATAPLRRRTHRDDLRRLVTEGPVSGRSRT